MRAKLGLVTIVLVASCSSRSGQEATLDPLGGAAGMFSTAGTGGSGVGSAGDGGAGGGGSAGTPSAAGSAGTGGGVQPASPVTIVVSAGDFDRDHSIVTFPLAGLEATAYALVDEQGGSVPLQVSSDGTATFILPLLAQGTEQRFTLEPLEAALAPGADAVDGDDQVTLRVGELDLLRFRKEGVLPQGVAPIYRRGGYIHPLYSPTGAIVTDDYHPSHVWHHGIWSAWTRSEYDGYSIDFWNMGDGQGKVDFEALAGVWQGAVHAGFEADLVHVNLLAPEPETVLEERWKVTAYKTHDAALPYFVFDLESTQAAATAVPVLLEEYIYGGFGIRGSAEWLDGSKVNFLTSEGLDRSNGDDTNGRWLYLGGELADGVAGFAVLGHPRNFRAPQPFRIHPDEPYASLSPVKEGAFSIEPGTPYVTRFRIVSFDGPPDAALLDALWNDYATPPSVSTE